MGVFSVAAKKDELMGRIVKRALVATLGLTLYACGGLRSPGGSYPDYYVADGSKIALRIDGSRIALRPHEGARPGLDSLVQNHPLLQFDQRSREQYPDQRIVIGSLSGGGKLLGVDSVYARLVNDSKVVNDRLVEFVGLVVVLRDRPPGADSTIVLTNRVLALFEAAADSALRSRIYRDLGLELVREIANRPRWVVLRPLSKSPRDALNAANQLAERYANLVEFAHPDFIVRTVGLGVVGCSGTGPYPEPFPCFTPSEQYVSPNPDPAIGMQWHLNNAASAAADVDAFEAWWLERGNASVVIAVIDDGIETLHPDLVDGVLPNSALALRNFTALNEEDWDDNPRPGCCTGCNDDHGTPVAGIAVARGDNGTGGSGVCPDCTLLPIRARAGSIGNHAEAILAAMDQGAWIINLSWGYSNAEPYRAVRTAINEVAHSGRGGAGTVVVSAAIEDFCARRNHASLRTTLAVGQSDANVNSLVGIGGDCLDVIAPGDQIYTTTYDPEKCQSSYGTFNGPSAAAPIVSGIAGLILSATPTLSAAQVRDIIRKTADKVGNCDYNDQGFHRRCGYGRVNAYCAVAMACSLQCIE